MCKALEDIRALGREEGIAQEIVEFAPKNWIGVLSRLFRDCRKNCISSRKLPGNI